MTSKTPILGDLESLVSFMKTDEKLKFLTQSYRQTGKKTFKADAPLFAPACHLEGGKGQDNIRELTHLSLVDFDELFTEVPPDITALNPLKQKLCADPHTLLCYITMSGNGIRVIYPYLGDDYPAAFAKGNDYYQQLIGKNADFQCKNVNRLSGLAYDPDAYYNSDAISFSAEEISLFHTETTKKNQKQKKAGPHQHLLRANHQAETRQRQDYLSARQAQQLCDAGGLYARQKALCPCRCTEVGSPEVPRV